MAKAVAGLCLVGRPPVDWRFPFEAVIDWIERRPEEKRDADLAKNLAEYLNRV
jgi:hypothetical protein